MPASSHARLRAAIDVERARIAKGERPLYHATWSTAIDGSIDVMVEELPLIHQFVPAESDVHDGARFLIARILEVHPASFDVLPADVARPPGRRRRPARKGTNMTADPVGLPGCEHLLTVAATATIGLLLVMARL